ncbi:Hypothetical protein PENO1_107250 [Penicillium occitanis (nom. inval.)]|nr:Hypothetical protein PENO1_107250 [Penicillium occitanis (nom. inval.)]PCG89163.1 hypothetical protein PENOC_107690 [Penicillium occitanis (nom. inval.)]
MDMLVPSTLKTKGLSSPVDVDTGNVTGLYAVITYRELKAEKGGVELFRQSLQRRLGLSPSDRYYGSEKVVGAHDAVAWRQSRFFIVLLRFGRRKNRAVRSAFELDYFGKPVMVHVPMPKTGPSTVKTFVNEWQAFIEHVPKGFSGNVFGKRLSSGEVDPPHGQTLLRELLRITRALDANIKELEGAILAELQENGS